MRTKLIFGFSGVGKTTVVKQLNKGRDPLDRIAIDFDYGMVKQTREILNANARTVNALAKCYKYIFTFAKTINPDVLDPSLYSVYVVYPSMDSKFTMIERIRKRNPNNSEFINRYSREFETRVMEDMEFARRVSSRLHPKVIELANGEFLTLDKLQFNN